jgi:HIV-1 Vpr-binding protein
VEAAHQREASTATATHAAATHAAASHAGAAGTDTATAIDVSNNKTYPAAAAFLPGNPQLPESLAALCSLLAHRKFAVSFVDRGGVRALLALPKGPLTHHGFARCLFGVSQVTSAMERLLAPPASSTAGAARRCVDAALEALEGGHDSARRNAALFLSLSFPFPAVLDAFDSAG